MNGVSIFIPGKDCGNFPTDACKSGLKCLDVSKRYIILQDINIYILFSQSIKYSHDKDVLSIPLQIMLI